MQKWDIGVGGELIEGVGGGGRKGVKGEDGKRGNERGELSVCVS